MANVTPVVQPDYTTSPARFIETATGKQILLRGVNVNMDAASSTISFIDTLGCNMVRINCYWNLIEPTAPTGSGTDFSTYVHTYSSSALGQIDTIVNHCAGLTVQGNPVMCLIDFHQAGWSPFFAGFSGVPSWYYTDARFPGSSWTTSQKSTAIGAWWTTELSASQALYTAFATMMVARYSQHANVIMYGSFNEPNAGNLAGTSRSRTTTMHTWLAPVVQAMSAADAGSGGTGLAPMRGITVMNRGGGTGYGTADFSPFGTQTQMQDLNLVLESHMYYVGLKPGYPASLSTDYGLNSAGDDYLPNDTAVHINLSPGYVGQEQYQANFHSVYKTAANTLGLPWFHGEWGVNFDDSGWSAYQSQMQSYFDNNKVSTTRWLLAPVNGPGSLNLINNGTLTGTGQALQTWFQNTQFTLGGTTAIPANSVPPTLNDDTPQVGEQLLCSPGSWTGNPTPTFTYQWQTSASAGGPFANLATGNTYTVDSSQLGQFLRCQVTGTNSAGGATANSEVTSAVVAAGGTVPVNTTAPALTDSTRSQPATSGVIAGDILTTTDGIWTNSPTSFTYQWQSQAPGGAITNVSGDPNTPNTYDSTLADVGNMIRCQVTATNGSGSGVPANTAWTNPLLAPATQNAVIWYTSDNGTGANQSHTLSIFNNLPLTGSGVDLVVDGGDTYAIGKAADFTSDIPPVYGPNGRNVYPLMVHTIGNHDWDNASAGYDAFYTGKGTKTFISPHYGRIDLAGWTLLFLNGYQAKTQNAGTTTPAPDSSAGVGATQLAWLTNNLPGGTNNQNGIDKQCIVFCHNMRWSCSQNHLDNANLDNVWKAIQGKAVAWVHGHAHNMSMQKPRDGSGSVAVDAADGTPGGVYDICCGAGGEGNYSQNTGYTPSPLFFRGNAGSPQYGYLLVRINGNAATFEFHDQNSGFSGTPLFSKTVLGSPNSVPQTQPPTNTSVPTISDTTPAVQETLSANPGTWTGTAPITFSSVWQISQDGGATWSTGTGLVGADPSIAGMTTYTVGSGDIGFPIRVRVTAANSVGRVDAFSAATANVSGTTPSVPVLVSPPVVTPTNPSVGTQLSTTDGVWLNSPTSFTYQWQESDAVGNITTLAGETSSTYVVQNTDASLMLSCVVTATNTNGSSVPVPSNTTSPVTQIVPGQLTVSITDPPNGATVTTTLITVTVDAEDTDGIQSVEVRPLRTDGTWTGAWVQAFGAYPLFSAQLALAGGDGEYEIDARATANPPAV